MAFKVLLLLTILRSYTMPGRGPDTYSHGTQVLEDPVLDARPRRGRLRAYDLPPEQINDFSSNRIRHLRRVWGYPRGQELFADVMNVKPEHLEGELANPGWVLNTLLGPIPQERVPVVFIWTNDASAPIDPAFPKNNIAQ